MLLLESAAKGRERGQAKCLIIRSRWSRLRGRSTNVKDTGIGVDGFAVANNCILDYSMSQSFYVDFGEAVSN